MDASIGPLRIAQVAPLWLPVPPAGYGGTERVVHALTEELVRRGHEVTLFAAGGSRTSARLRAASEHPLWEVPSGEHLARQVIQVEELVRCSGQFDVVHSHVELFLWLAGERIRAPLVTTLHGRLDLPHLRPLFATYRGAALVSISDAQRAPLRDLRLNWVATVHHGLDLASSFALGRGQGGYALFLGRIAPEKDPATAIRVAIRAGVPLRIAARVDPMDRAYFEREVAPHLDHPLIEWLGEVGHEGKAALLGEATALLVPVDWPEPFGLVFIEALACGTPVVARPRGSLPEIVRHGEQGWLLETEEEMAEALRGVASIDRAACRGYALSRFSTARMTDEYEAVYRAAMAPPALRRALTERGRREGLSLAAP